MEEKGGRARRNKGGTRKRRSEGERGDRTKRRMRRKNRRRQMMGARYHGKSRENDNATTNRTQQRTAETKTQATQPETS
jgi:hypothetical protein